MNRKLRQNRVWLLVARLLLISIFQFANAADNNGADSARLLQANANSLTYQQQNKSSREQKHYSRSKQDYITPDIILLNRHGEQIHVQDLLNDKQPVLLQFVFTTCTTICPVLSATFSSAQRAFKVIAPNYRMISISIDPEQDTPHTLNDYANRFKVGSQWHLLTGPRDKIAQIQHAFDAYYPGNNKMYHLPYTYLRAQGVKTWVRLDGLLSTEDLIEEYRRLTYSATQPEIRNDQ